MKSFNMELPCTNCELINKCEENSLECSAFRNWSAKGTYKKIHIAHLIRSINSYNIKRRALRAIFLLD